MKAPWKRRRPVAPPAAAAPVTKFLGETRLTLPSPGQQDRMSQSFIDGWVNSTHIVGGSMDFATYYLACSPAAWRAATLLATIIGQMKWQQYAEDEDPNLPDLKMPTALFIRRPEPTRTAFQTYFSAALDYLLAGSAMFVKGPTDEFGAPTALMPVQSAAVGVQWVDPAAPPYLLDITGRLYLINADILPGSQMVHIQGPSSPNQLRGMAALEVLCQQRELWATLNGQALDTAKSGGVPTGVVSDQSPDAGEPEVAALKAAWMASQAARTMAFTNGQVVFTPVAWNPSDTQLLEARQFSLTEVALAFGLPLHFVAATPEGGLTYSTTALEADDLLKFGKPAEMISAFEQALSDLLPPGQYIKADPSWLLRMDPAARAAFYTAALNPETGWMDRNEVRAEENLPPAVEPEAPADQEGDESE